jgi:hypothetical protein
MSINRSFLLSVLVLGAGILNQAVAGSVAVGNYSYSPTGQTDSAGACGVFNFDNFAGQVSQDGPDGFTNAALTFSICDTPGVVTGGSFNLVVDADDTITGIMSGIDTGATHVTGSIFDEGVSGTFTVTGGTGLYADSVGYSDVFTADTLVDESTGGGSGTFLIGTPEPSTMALAGMAIAALGFLKKRRASSL